MTQTEYDKAKQECLSDFCKEHGFIETADVKGIFGYAFDRAYALGKQFGNSEQVDADTVIQGWVGRDMSGSLYVYCHEPERNLMKCLWEGDIMSISLSDDMFPDLTWDSDPEPVEIIIKRKKNG